MTVAAPVSLVAIDESVLSSYDRAGKSGGARSSLTPLARLGKAGVAVPEVARALLALSNAVLAAGGDLRVTECHRDLAVQRTARDRYDRWVAAGKPPAGSPSFDARTMKAAFVAPPGRSNHNAGRAIDLHLSMLRFPGIPANGILDRLWEIAKPLGWSPIIKAPEESASEAWHFDYWGELAGVYRRLGYEQGALCGAVLVGHGDLSSYEAVVQSLLSRAGFDLGAIDGVAGRRTVSSLATALRCSENDAKAKIVARDGSVLPLLAALPPG